MGITQRIYNQMRKLYFGLSGSDVKELQMKLEQLGYADFTPTSFFGAKTHLAVRRFQRDNNLPINGIFSQTEASIMGIRETKTQSELFFDHCMRYLNTDVTPKDEVDDDVACMVTVDTLYKLFTGSYLNGNTITQSTLSGLNVFSKHPRFIRTNKPGKGVILLYPTGLGNGRLANGHIFVCGDNGLLYSNSSSNGLFQQNYNTFTAKYRYETIGGFPPHYFMLM